MTQNLWKILKSSTISIPRLLLLQYKNMKISDRQFVLIVYLLGSENMNFNPKQIGNDLGLTLEEVMGEFAILTSLGLVSLEVKKIGNMRDEVINLDGLYQKLAYLVVNGAEEEKKEVSTDIFTTFEKEY